MKRPLLILTTALLALAACDKKPGNDAQREADEKRIAELRDLESRQAQRDADAQQAQLDEDRQRLANDQAALEAERQRVNDEKAAVQDDAARLAKWRADEKRLTQREAALRDEQDKAKAAREARAREQARTDAKQDAADRQIDFFYSALDPLGDWMEVQPYGYVWQPREAQGRSWRPYADGTWVYTDYGWTWKGNEPFGWATYHYGRWAQVKRVGWVWVPGSEWAPAWVSWRKSPQYVGWAPLPPEAHSGSGFNAGVDSYYDIGPASYNFIPVASLGEPTYRDVVVEPERNVTIVNQTVNITKINYTTVEQKTVIFNGGPDLQEMNGESRRPVPRLRLEREAGRDRVGSEGAANAVVGGVLRLLAPSIGSAPRGGGGPAPTRLKERVERAEIQHGWDDGNAVQAQAVRTQFRQEAGAAEEQQRRHPHGGPGANRPATDASALEPADRQPGRDQPRHIESAARPAQPAEHPPTNGSRPGEGRNPREAAPEPRASQGREQDPAAMTAPRATPGRVRPPENTDGDRQATPAPIKATPGREERPPRGAATPRATPAPAAPAAQEETPAATPRSPRPTPPVRPTNRPRPAAPAEAEATTPRPAGAQPMEAAETRPAAATPPLRRPGRPANTAPGQEGAAPLRTATPASAEPTAPPRPRTTPASLTPPTPSRGPSVPAEGESPSGRPSRPEAAPEAPTTAERDRPGVSRPRPGASPAAEATRAEAPAPATSDVPAGTARRGRAGREPAAREASAEAATTPVPPSGPKMER